MVKQLTREALETNGHSYLIKSRLNGDFWFGVKGWRGLIKKQDPWIANQCPCDRYPLLLSSTQLGSTLSNQRLIFLTTTQLVSQLLPTVRSQIILQLKH